MTIGNTPATKITKPHNCIVGIAVPTSKEDYLKDLNPSSKKDFIKCHARKFAGASEAFLWSAYSDLIILINNQADILQKMGVKVILNFSSADVGLISDYQVFMLVAHWVDAKQEVELYDGLISARKLEEILPGNFDGIFDLSICHSIFLQDAIKSRRNNIVIGNAETAALKFKLITFKYCMDYLNFRECNYIDAYAEIRKNIILTFN